MVKFTGFDGFAKQLKEAQETLAALGDEVAIVNFDPNDPASIEAAIQKVELVIDGRAGSYSSNPIVAHMIEQLKEKYREAIIEKAAAARLGRA